MPPKVTETRTATTESLHTVAQETADAARRIVATYAHDFFDFATLSSMLGVAPRELKYSKLAAEQAAAEEPKAPAKKTTKKAAAKKTTKKAAAKKTTKKTAKKAATKAAD